MARKSSNRLGARNAHTVPAKYSYVKRAKDGSYEAHVHLASSRSVAVGRWPSPREAAVAVDRAILHFGLVRPLNEPRVSRRLGPAPPDELRRLARLASKRNRSDERYLGVRRAGTGTRTWEAYATIGGRRVCVGYFHDEEAAAIARDRFLLGVPGARARLNFPRGTLEPAARSELRAPERRKANRGQPGRFEGVRRSQNPHLRWCAHLNIDKSSLFLGAWCTRTQAARAYDRAVLQYLGPDGFLNFPKEKNELRPAHALVLRAEAQRERKASTSSRFLGVYRDAPRGRWIAKIMVDRVVHNVGRFDDEETAARERDLVALRLLGGSAPLNFHPTTGEELHGRRLADVKGRGRSPGAVRARASRTHKSRTGKP